MIPSDAAIRLKTLLGALPVLAVLIGTPLLWSASPWVLAGVAVAGAVLGLIIDLLVRMVRPH